ncbi:hypothetical protein [Escherichia coli]|nr:hypothetical protein [Escherichia coli]
MWLKISKEEGRRKKEEGRRKKEEGRIKWCPADSYHRDTINRIVE